MKAEQLRPGMVFIISRGGESLTEMIISNVDDHYYDNVNLLVLVIDHVRCHSYVREFVFAREREVFKEWRTLA
jgi:hypothetical protein